MQVAHRRLAKLTAILSTSISAICYRNILLRLCGSLDERVKEASLNLAYWAARN